MYADDNTVESNNRDNLLMATANYEANYFKNFKFNS